MRLHQITAATGLALAASIVMMPPAAASAGDRDCPDFSSQAEAQAVFDANPSDPERLDGDGDGLACEESFPGGVSDPGTSTPQGGVATGAGGTAGLESEGLFAFGGLALAGAAGVVLYRRRAATDGA